MRKKKILFHSNYHRAYTGFGKNAKNVLKYLAETGKYEIIEVANGKLYSDESLLHEPWKVVGSLPDSHHKLHALNHDPHQARNAAYGLEMIDKIVHDERPDVYLGVEDPWAFMQTISKPWWNKISCMVWTTLDSLPIYQPLLDNLPKFKNLYSWSSFAEEEAKSKGLGIFKTLHGCVSSESFYRLPDEERAKLRYGCHIDEDAFIIGFVFRNQLRKSLPNLLNGFSLFKRANPNSKAKLLLHTSWKEGWPIAKYAQEYGVSMDDILTTHVCRNCGNFAVHRFVGHDQDCRACGSKGTYNTVDTQHGVSENGLNLIYNLMDVYCHPFTSGGQEIPLQEAKYTELITLATNYSCGIDAVCEGSGGLPLTWSEYREPGTEFIKATTHPESIAEQLQRVFDMTQEERLAMGREAREYALREYSIESIGAKLEEILDAFPYIDDDLELRPPKMNPNFISDRSLPPPIWLVQMYKNVLKMDVTPDHVDVQHWLQQLQAGAPPDEVENFFHQVAAQQNAINFPFDVTEYLGEEKPEDRILICIDHQPLIILYSLFYIENLKKRFPNKEIYLAVPEQFHFMIKGTPHIKKVIPYHKDLEDLSVMEMRAPNKGLFKCVLKPAQENVNLEVNANGGLF